MAQVAKKITLPEQEPRADYQPYNDRWTTIEGYQIKVKATVADLARKMDNHNQSRGFTNALLIGDSGSGKTTMRTHLIHELHQKHPYIIKYFYEEQILNLKKIIKQLPKHHDYIIAFDDVSFLVKKGIMKEDELMSMFHELTKIRHTVKGRVIAIFNIHYPYAIEKFMRQAGYRILTSITDDEREIYVKLFGPQSRQLIEAFIRDDRYQTEEGQFFLPDSSGNRVKFTPKNPFKLGIASRMGDLTYIVYQKVECSICTESKDKNFDKSWIIEQRAKYKEKRFLRVAKWFAFINSGVSVLPKNDRALYNAFVKYTQENGIAMKQLVDILQDVKNAPAEERDAFLMKQLEKLEENLKKGGETVPDELMQNEMDKEPESETDDEDDEDDDDIDDGFVLSGKLDHDGDGLAFDPLDQNSPYSEEDDV